MELFLKAVFLLLLTGPPAVSKRLNKKALSKASATSASKCGVEGASMLEPGVDHGSCGGGMYCQNNCCVGCQDVEAYNGQPNYCHVQLVVNRNQYCTLPWFVQLCPSSCADCQASAAEDSQPTLVGAQTNGDEAKAVGSKRNAVSLAAALGRFPDPVGFIGNAVKGAKKWVQKKVQKMKEMKEMTAAAVKSEEWFLKMLSEGEPADFVRFNTVINYNTVINAWAQAADPVKAEEWLLNMRSAGVLPDAVSYNTVINAWAQAANPDMAEFWLEKMLEYAEVPPNSKSYSTVINAWAQSGHPAKADKWLAKKIEMAPGPEEDG